MTDLTAEETTALLDCIEYYRANDFGCGGNGPTNETERAHVREVRSAEHKILADKLRRDAPHQTVATGGDEVEHRDRPEYGIGKVVGRMNDGRPIVAWPGGRRGPVEAPSLRVVDRTTA